MDDAELAEWPPFVAAVIEEALQFAVNHPRVALSQARVAAEAICVHVHRREIGEPGKAMLDELIRKLATKKLVPPQRELSLRTVQAWGNYGAHPIDFAKLDAAFVAPCMAALQQVAHWYFVDYLKQDLPAALRSSPAPSSASKRSDAIVVVAKNQRFPLRRGTTMSLGRDPSADIALDETDLKVHRQHARFEFPAVGPLRIHEVTGKNATRVNDVRITGSAELRNGDHVQVGRTILRLELGDDE
jgi:hypothetical protein